MKIGFNGVSGVSSSQPKLKAWQIHDVQFKGVEFSSFAGKKDPSATWQVMRTKFEGKDGVFEETTFCPKDGDEIRPKNGDRENPSALERFQFFVAQLGQQLEPERFKKFQGVQFDLPGDFEKMVKSLNECLKPSIGKTVKLKLIGNKKGEAVLPYFVNLNREGQPYTSNNFIGDKVFFTDYELTTMEQQKAAKPTDMEGEAGDGLNTEVSSGVSNDDLNFEV